MMIAIIVSLLALLAWTIWNCPASEPIEVDAEVIRLRAALILIKQFEGEDCHAMRRIAREALR